MLHSPQILIPTPRKYEIPYHLTIALNQIGTTEISGDKSNVIINRYLKTVGQKGDDEIPWCSAFVNWCLIEANLPGTGKPNARSFLDYRREEQGVSTELAFPELGCLVVLSRGTKSWQGHVGIYLDHHRSLIRILGGNQKNRVGINAYPSNKLLGYRKVEYG